MRKAVIICVAAAQMAGCAMFQQAGSWQEKAGVVIGRLFASSQAIRQDALPVFAQECQSYGQECFEANAEECPKFQTCAEAFMVAADTLKAIDYLLLDAELAIEAGDQETADEKIAAAMALVADVVGQLRSLGVMP
jgi:hypothetical protein